MDKALIMHVAKSHQNLACYFRGLLFLELASSFDQLIEIASRAILHDNPDSLLLPIFIGLQIANYMRVSKLLHGCDLSMKQVVIIILFLKFTFVYHLDGYLGAYTFILGQDD